MFRSTVAACILATLVAGCGLKLPHISVQAPSNDPQTLEAATSASQEVADRRTSGDFAGVWLMMSKQVRDGITQDDYVTLGQTCDPTGLSAKVVGVRMEGSSKAIVRWQAGAPELRAFGAITNTMLYEDGKWDLAPTPEFVTELGQPVALIIAAEKGAGRCDKSASSSASSTATTTSDPCAETGYCHTPTASAPAGEPSRYALPACYGKGGARTIHIKPDTTTAACRFHWYEGLTWTTWGASGADGSGTEQLSNCNPSCAGGDTFRNSVEVHFSAPEAPPADSECPTEKLYYTQLIVVYPSAPPPQDASSSSSRDNPVAFRYNDRPAFRWNSLVPYCQSLGPYDR